MSNEKHIFIGLGGSGCQTVSMIKSKVYEKRFKEATESKTRLQAMNDSYRFLFIDTDQRDIDLANKNNRENFEQGKTPFISPQTDLVNLGRANPQAIYYEAKRDPNTLINKRILEACSPELSVKIPDQPLAFGAGAFRMKSRIAFAHSLTDFQNKLQAAISSLNDVKTVGGEDCIIYYWVVASTLGGTGSGIINDVLYHINQLHYQVVGNGDPQLVLTMYMPKVYIDCNSTEEKYALNAFGVFSELEAFKKMSFSEKQNIVMHRLAFQNDYNLIDSERRYCPFYYLIPIDIQTDKGTSLGNTHTMYHNTAEMLFHLHNGTAGATFRSDIDNYMNDIMERSHEDFLVPMGYVSLQKPQEQFAKYMRTRLKRDILKSWLLCDDEKQAKVEKSDVKELYNAFFEELNPDASKSVARGLLSGFSTLKGSINAQAIQDNKIDDSYTFGAIDMKLNNVKRVFQDEKTEEKRNKYKKMLVDGIWEQAEQLIRSHGITYTLNAIKDVREYLRDEYKSEESGDNSIENRKKALEKDVNDLQELSNDAAEIGKLEGKKTNLGKAEDYVQRITQYVTKQIDIQVAEWAHDLKRDFCTDEKNDELAKLYNHLVTVQEKAAEMNRSAVESYNKLSTEFGEASMDVTTVYLPRLQTICDGNGWIVGNFFSNLYGKVIGALPDKEETPIRDKMASDLIDKSIYNAPNPNTKAAIEKGGYIIYLDAKDQEDNDNAKKKKDSTRFFANPVLIESKVSVERIIEDFLSMVTTIFEKRLHEDESIQTLWYNKKISSFFNELTNDQKDEVRRSLNPALFFNYNANRIDVAKKEEHIVFVAGSEELATEMLGYQKGNPRHRSEKADDENTALVLKSKFGLSLKDYRMYESIKMVYDRATFREKYHFHHSFAQYLDKLTIDDLPLEKLPQHRTMAKILMMNLYAKDLEPFFYKDEIDPDSNSFTNVLMYLDHDASFWIAKPEAFGVTKDGKIFLKKDDNGRPLYQEVIGKDFAEQFKQYKDMYFNYRFGETTESFIQTVYGKAEKTLKDGYDSYRKQLLKELSDKRKTAAQPAEIRLYTTLFNIIRDDFETIHEFIK